MNLTAWPQSVEHRQALTDAWARPLRYLRVSVTDRCNYRCRYCMPETEWRPSPREALLTFEEITRLVGIFARHGVNKVRITGGEPLIRKGLPELVSRIASTPGIIETAMTTNGHLLRDFAPALRSAGLTKLTVSLDAFEPQIFKEITGGGEVQRVIDGLNAAQEVGFDKIGVNVVAIRGVNDGRLAEMASRCWDSGWTPRFIELMPIGDLPFYGEGRQVTSDQIRGELSETFALSPMRTRAGAGNAGPARYYEVAEGPYRGHTLGLISPMSDSHFCESCNRARLTAQGGFRPCLANDQELSLLKEMRDGRSDEEIASMLARELMGKRESHRMTDGTFIPLSAMTGIGG